MSSSNEPNEMTLEQMRRKVQQIIDEDAAQREVLQLQRRFDALRRMDPVERTDASIGALQRRFDKLITPSNEKPLQRRMDELQRRLDKYLSWQSFMSRPNYDPYSFLPVTRPNPRLFSGPEYTSRRPYVSRSSTRSSSPAAVDHTPAAHPQQRRPMRRVRRPRRPPRRFVRRR